MAGFDSGFSEGAPKSGTGPGNQENHFLLCILHGDSRSMRVAAPGGRSL
jgi:hypothetical protein